MNATTPSWVSNYQPGVPAEIELPTESLFDLLLRSVAEAGPATALTFFGRTTTYAELGDQVLRAAQALRDLGVKKGDRVAIVLPNCPQPKGAILTHFNLYANARQGAAWMKDAEVVRNQCREELAAYKVPKRIVRSDGELPRSMLGKVLRKKVRESLPLDLV